MTVSSNAGSQTGAHGFMKRITLEALLAGKRQADYGQQYMYITGLLESGRVGR